jgi:ABC-type nitrate/sulfonate/bicarbonate transport system ATPase subunit
MGSFTGVTMATAVPPTPKGPMLGTAITLSEVTKSYAGARVLERFSLVVPPGEVVALLGPSGCGKTTILRLIAGLERADQGSVDIRGTEPASPPVVAFVFQDHRLFPWLRVLENVLLAARLRGGPTVADAGRAEGLLAGLGLAGYARHYPHQLSVGMQQRVSLARAMFSKPSLLLLDEPLSSLDELTAHRSASLLHKSLRDATSTIVLVTHRPEEAASLADRVVVLSGSRPTRLVHDEYVGGADGRGPGRVGEGPSEIAERLRAVALRFGGDE